MKFSYWGGIKSGKFQLWQLFETNGKSTAIFPKAGKKWPAYVILYKGESVRLIYEEQNQIKNKFVSSMGNGKEGQKHMHYIEGIDRQWTSNPQNFFRCFDTVFNQDLIICPYMMLGYHGKEGSKEFNDMIEKRETNLNVDLDYSIMMMKKRRNIIPYKSDKFYEAYAFMRVDSDPDVCIERYKNTQRQRELTKELLTEYDIPFEIYDIDSDWSYFGLDKPLPQNMLYQDPLNVDLPHQVMLERVDMIRSAIL